MAKKGTTKYQSNKQEKSVAKLFEGRTVVASGAKWFADSDVRNNKCLVECKTTSKDYYPLFATVWEKIESEAISDGMRIPLLVVDLEYKDRIVVFDPKYFETTIPEPYEGSITKEEVFSKSFRVSKKSLEDSSLDFCCYVYSKLFRVCGKKPHLLCYMRVKDFIETYKEEVL